MCMQCWYSTQAYLPEVDEEEVMDILWNFTAFPTGSADLITLQLEELHQRCTYGHILHGSGNHADTGERLDTD